MEDRENYLGSFMSGRMPRAGSGSTGGRDMPDGRFSRELFEKIMRDIFAIELVKVWKPKESKPIIVDIKEFK